MNLSKKDNNKLSSNAVCVKHKKRRKIKGIAHFACEIDARDFGI